jgi:glycosyltransferase involved in cell wall biosynthesis
MVLFLLDGALAPLVWFGRFRGMPVVCLTHGRDVTLPSPLYQSLVVRSLREVDRIVCVSEASRRALIERSIPAQRIHVIPNGVSELVDREDLRFVERKFSGKLLLSVGRQVQRKGYHWFLAEVFPSLVVQVPDVHFVMVGDGPLHSRLRKIAREKGIADRVSFLVDIDDVTLAMLYTQADVFVMPNIPVEGDMEGFGIASAEAMFYGCPVVASHLEGLGQVLPNDDVGVRIPPREVSAFAKEIVRLLSDPGQARALAERGRAFAVQAFSWDKAVETYERVFAEVARHG